MDAAKNKLPANWCNGTVSYNGDLGTPGAENPSCVPMLTVLRVGDGITALSSSASAVSLERRDIYGTLDTMVALAPY